MPGRVTVRTTDGRELTAEVLYPKGNPRNPLTEDEFKAKFMDMAERVLGDDQADELYRRARELRSAPRRRRPRAAVQPEVTRPEEEADPWA